MRLPLLPEGAAFDGAHGEAGAIPASSAIPEPLATTSGAATSEPAPRRHVLLVEDHADTAEAIDQLLRMLGLEVSVAGSIAAALDTAGRGGIDLVISDLGLPDGDGHELMHRLTERHTLRGIALSGYGRDEDLRRSREAGFDIHLIKPVTLETLQSAIEQLGLLP